MLVTNVMVVIKECVSTAVSLQKKKPWAPSLCVCEWHCLCFTYLWQMLAEWNWIPGNEGERSQRASFFMSRDRISPGQPWSLDCLPCNVVGDNDKGRGWNRLFLSHRAKEPLSFCWFESDNISIRQNRGKNRFKCSAHDTLYAAVQISCVIILFSSNRAGKLQATASTPRFE